MIFLDFEYPEDPHDPDDEENVELLYEAENWLNDYFSVLNVKRYGALKTFPFTLDWQ